MSTWSDMATRTWTRLGTRFLPFADAASPELPLGRLLRLSLFQVSVGMAMVLLGGTLNRVMILDLGVAAWLVAGMAALPVLFAPLRTLVGFRSDHHRSAIGWRRVPYIWLGTLVQFGGLAIMPFALLVLSGDGDGPAWLGQAGAALAFLLVGIGMHTTQTAGLALATDLARPDLRPRVVALLYAMLLAGMIASALIFGRLLAEFTPLRLVQVIQGAAVATMGLNILALWKQEARRPRKHSPSTTTETLFGPAWNAFIAVPDRRRFLVAVALGTAGFTMQDILLEPYGGEVLHLSVGDTTTLTAFMAGGALLAFAFAARALNRGTNAYRLAASGVVIGVFAFAAVMLAAPMDSSLLFRCGSALIGLGGGLFSIGTLTAAMGRDTANDAGLVLGAWGAVQATAAGLGIAAGGILRDLASSVAATGALGPDMAGAAVGYGTVYQLEIVLLFATLVAIGPLVRSDSAQSHLSARFGLAQLPG